MFKANLARLTALRQCKPEIELEVLRRLPDWFPTNGYEYQLDPSYEPEAEPKHPAHEEIFSCFQRLRNARLLCCVGEQHLYYAALNSKRCKLSQLGEFYRDLAAKGRL